jgi:capsular polysaccharide biosynthesis protein
MDWTGYWTVLRRRWLIISGVLVLAVLASGYSFLRSYRHVGSQSCLTLYVSDVSSPSMIAASQTNLAATGQLLAGETAANFFGDDILDVAQSRRVADDVSARLRPQRLSSTAPSDMEGAVSGSRRDRTVNLCVQNPSSASALAAAQALGIAMTSGRARFIGRQMARRTFVSVISQPTVGRVSRSHLLVTLVERLFLGLVAALGVAFLWDALDPTVRDQRDVERALGAPVLATYS